MALKFVKSYRLYVDFFIFYQPYKNNKTLRFFMNRRVILIYCSVLINQINAIAATNRMISSITKIANNAFALFLS